MQTSVGNLKKITSLDPKQILTGTTFYDPSVKNILAASKDSIGFLNSLIEKKFYKDAISFLSLGLPKRESVWWGCLCARQTIKEDTLPQETQAIEAAENWVYNPSDEEGFKAKELSEALEFKTPGSWVAIAAFWSQGSIAPRGASPIKTPEGLPAHAIAGAIMLAAALLNPSHIEATYEEFISQGIEIANGGNGKQ